MKNLANATSAVKPATVLCSSRELDIVISTNPTYLAARPTQQHDSGVGAVETLIENDGVSVGPFATGARLQRLGFTWSA